MAKLQGFERYFRVISYVVALCGLFALFASGGVGILVFSAFLMVSLFAWFLEDTKWQISERLAVGIVAVVLFGFFADWRLGITGIWSDGVFAAAGLSRLILFFAAIKLLQRKADKDWIFIYLISFFEILLAAGLSISPLYLVSIVGYLFFTTCAIVAFEIRKSSRIEPSAADKNRDTGMRRVLPQKPFTKTPTLKLPVLSVVLLFLIILIGLPIFFSLPRGEAGNFANPFSNPLNVTGFSDSVSLGTIGRLQKNDKIVMRVRIDQNENERLNKILWRGVALDQFDNRRWTKSRPRYRLPFVPGPNKVIQLDYSRPNVKTTVQTFYLEPLSTSVLFALKRPFAVKGVDIVNKDAEGSLLGFLNRSARTIYTVYSDTSEPPADTLIQDAVPYTEQHFRYLQVPLNLDPRISELAEKYVEEAAADNRYDSAAAIESRLRNDFKYSLDMRAGGAQPIADFLFNIRSGHCEYFASAMAMMLRSQGIATRVVNGFQTGDYNATAGVYVVRQYNAHSWVEVYFPATKSWIAFDPTPSDGQPGAGSRTFASMISGYLEALETFWIQYVVAYDGKEQLSLLRRFRDRMSVYADTGGGYLEAAQASIGDWWEDLRGDDGVIAGLIAAGYGLIAVALGLILFFGGRILYRLFGRLAIFRWIARKFGRGEGAEVVAFYDEMQRLLAKNGFVRQGFETPFEFAIETGIPEVNAITDKYNRVRFGRYRLNEDEKQQIVTELESIRERFKGKSTID
jgi:transglutaminase-like putative cysteine protease